MHICLVSQEYPPETVRGGVGVQTWNKAHALAALDHSVHVVSCADKSGPRIVTDDHGNITVHRIPAPDKDLAVYATETYWLGYSWQVLRTLGRLSVEVAFDVIDFAEYGAEGFAFQTNRSRWNWVPVVVQLHAPLAMFADHIGWPDKNSDFYQIGTFMERFSIQHADGLMACSANIADFSAQTYDIPRDDIEVVHCGVDTEAFHPGRDSLQKNLGSKVLFVGNIALNKGIKTTIDAVLRLRSSFPNLKLQILGKGDDGLVDDLKARVRSESAEECVEFCGFVPRDELPGYYREADVFCSPAAYEGGVANVYLEAMASGCPVIASAAGAAREAVVDEETGFIVPPGDVESVAFALRRILDDSSLRRQMGRNARKHIEQYFAMDRYIDRVYAVYRRAIERSRHRLSQLSDAES